MPRVKCNDQDTGCGYSWLFVSRVTSHLLKRSYWVRCPRCRARVFKRRKRQLIEPTECSEATEPVQGVPP